MNRHLPTTRITYEYDKPTGTATLTSHYIDRKTGDTISKEILKTQDEELAYRLYEVWEVFYGQKEIPSRAELRHTQLTALWTQKLFDHLGNQP